MPASRRAVALAACCALLLVRRVSALAPSWSWATVQSFVHCSNQSGPLSDEIVEMMAASSFSVIEKYACLSCAPAGHGGEAKVLAAARQIRAVNPDASVFFYFAVDYTRNWYALGDWFDAHPALEVHNADGTLATVKSEGNTWHVFDFAQPAALEAWVSAVAAEVRALPFDGLFIDGYRSEGGWAHGLIPGATSAEQAAWLRGAWNGTGTGLATALPGTIRIPNGNPQAAPPPGFNANSIEFFRPGAASVAQLEALAGQFVEVHAYIGNDAALFNTTLATYLLGAQEQQFFGAGNTWNTCESWLVPSQRADYARPLGAPLGAAVTSGSRISRSFSSGTAVELTVDAAGGAVSSCITWADGARTGACVSSGG